MQTEAGTAQINLADIKAEYPDYYLVGNLTTNDDTPNGYGNPSYLFTPGKDEDGNTIYTLYCARISGSDTFYVQSGNTVYGPERTESDLQMDSRPTLYPSTKEEMGLKGTYLNVVITLTPQANGELYVTFSGTPDTSDTFTVTLGNDKTNQSGTLSQPSSTADQGSIILYTENEAALVFVYSGSPVFYTKTDVTPINSSEASEVRRKAGETYVAASRYVDYGSNAYAISLETGYKGTLNLFTKTTDGAYDPKAVYSYSVILSKPTSVEALEECMEGESTYYTLQGVKVSNPQNGIYIRVSNGKAEKVVL